MLDGIGVRFSHPLVKFSKITHFAVSHTTPKSVNSRLSNKLASLYYKSVQSGPKCTKVYQSDLWWYFALYSPSAPKSLTVRLLLQRLHNLRLGNFRAKLAYVQD